MLSYRTPRKSTPRKSITRNRMPTPNRSHSNGKLSNGFTYSLATPELYAKHKKLFGIINTSTGRVVYKKPPWNKPPEYTQYNKTQKNRIQNTIKTRLKTLLRNILRILPNIIVGLNNIKSPESIGKNDIKKLESNISDILLTKTHNIDLDHVERTLYRANNILKYYKTLLKDDNFELTHTKIENEIKKLSKLAENGDLYFN